MDLRKKKCLRCGKKTLSHPQHRDWNAWKDRSKVYCRSCGSKFNVKRKPFTQADSAESVS